MKQSHTSVKHSVPVLLVTQIVPVPSTISPMLFLLAITNQDITVKHLLFVLLLANLADAVLSRFYQSGTLNDLDESVTLYE